MLENASPKVGTVKYHPKCLQLHPKISLNVLLEECPSAWDGEQLGHSSASHCPGDARGCSSIGSAKCLPGQFLPAESPSSSQQSSASYSTKGAHHLPTEQNSKLGTTASCTPSRHREKAPGHPWLLFLSQALPQPKLWPHGWVRARPRASPTQLSSTATIPVDTVHGAPCAQTKGLAPPKAR